MHSKEQHFLTFNGKSRIKCQLRWDFITSKKTFDEKLRQWERAYKRSVCDEIKKKNMTTDNPNEFWKKIKKLWPRKTSVIPMEDYDKMAT